ncbi:hypothetical protein LCGC14_2474680, partial [marine sediment metagenome]
AVQPKINQTLDPVSRTYRNTVELEMTTPKSGALLVTDAKVALKWYDTFGNEVYMYPALLKEPIPANKIIRALRAVGNRTYTYKPVDFGNIDNLPRTSAPQIEAYVRKNNMMITGSTAENTWTKTTKPAVDLDLTSLRNTAKVDADALARIIQDSSGFETRVVKPPNRDVFRIQKLNPKTGKWEQVSDVLDYSVHKTYNPKVKNYKPVDVEGIKVEHPLEQAERIVQKATEYPMPLEKHRGHPKRLKWIAEAILDAPGGRDLSASNKEILNTLATRLDYTTIRADIQKLTTNKLKNLVDSIRDSVNARRVRILKPDGTEDTVARDIVDDYDRWLARNPNATVADQNKVRLQLLDDATDTYIERLLRTNPKALEVSRSDADVKRLIRDIYNSRAKVDAEVEKMGYAEFERQLIGGQELLAENATRIYRQKILPYETPRALYVPTYLRYAPERPEDRLARIDRALAELARPELPMERAVLAEEIPLVGLREFPPEISERPVITERIIPTEV